MRIARGLGVLAMVVGAACGPGGATRTTGNPQVRVEGPETWNVGQRSWEIEETAVIYFHNGDCMLVVKAFHDEDPGPEHEPLARELAAYAVEHGYLKKAQAKLPEDRCRTLADRVGVALIQKLRTPAGSIARGRKYNFPVSELIQQTVPET